MNNHPFYTWMHFTDRIDDLQMEMINKKNNFLTNREWGERKT